jgi:acetyl esterase/lipase
MRSIRRLDLVFALLCLALTSRTTPASAQSKPPQLPKGFAAEMDVKYVPDGDPAQSLDIFYPEAKAEKPLPLLVWIHGGGWEAGSKANPPYLSQLPRGYVVASLEYRFSQKAIFPAQIQDCQAALRWLRANAKKYSIDPDKVGVGGASAGGHLSALVGTSGGAKAFPMIGGNEDQSDRVQCVCDIFGPTDFNTVIKQAEEDKNVKNIFKWNMGDPYSKLIGGGLGEDLEKGKAVSPTQYVSKDAPPFLIFHGDKDALVPYAQSVELTDKLKEAGVDVTLQKIPGAGHGGPQFASPPIIKLAVDFFDKHLKGVDAKIEAVPEEELQAKKR